ncbi:Helicase associated domain protein [Streptomyces sp. NBC_01433]|uniref:DEAD/DEAH box helicase n=1 Tax=Streptomyces sp. NBC_01433 TaxID=2903864 RepID=UPI0022596E8A|nr:DEAD/DEAH box helicase [Streptomyces sp. NBC_01433]MCX4682354.1 Helicase associated domain protein [Streptomyces sp. NBC_01433]
MSSGGAPEWRHIEEHIAAAARELSAGARIPAAGLRTLGVSAPGTGKTAVGFGTARKVVPGGRVLWLAPWRSLLVQTAAAWRAAGFSGRGVAVVSKSRPAFAEFGVQATTSPPQLGLWAGRGPVWVFATYDSLSLRQEDGEDVPGPIEQALLGAYGQQLEPFDLLVADEAHHTSGDGSKPWAAVHDNTRIVADRRLYLTATPKIWAVTEGRAGRKDRLVVSMDSEAVYGKRAFTYGLVAAVERGTLARFEIDVLEIADPDPQCADADDEAVRGRRLAVLQAALLKLAAEVRVRSLMTFHTRTVDAMACARAFPETAAELHASHPDRYPERVCAEWLCGDHTLEVRRLVMDRFGNGVDEDGRETDFSILASCKAVGEGQDIRGRRGVGGVVFADTRGSATEIVQNVGRALRQAPGEGKIARIVVPVYLQPGEKPDDMLTSPSYRPLVAVLQGLRSHGDGLIERLTLRTEHTGRGESEDVTGLDPHPVTPHGAKDAGDPGDSSEGDDQDQAEESQRRAAEMWEQLLKFSTPRDPDLIARFVERRILPPDSELWLTGYDFLHRWVGEHGHAQVPLTATVPAPGSKDEVYALGSWVSEQRRAQREGVLAPWRFDMLNALGMVWSVHDAAFEVWVSCARRYFEVYGTLAAPREAVIDGRAIGQALANFRKPGGLGKNAERARAREGLLRAVDPDWNPPWPITWQRHYAGLKACVDGGATLVDLRPGMLVFGDDIGLWLLQQQKDWGRLSEEQQRLLLEVGVLPTVRVALPVGATGGGGVLLAAEASSWERNLAAARQYRQREGHVRIPRAYRETVVDQAGVHHVMQIGVWRSNTRSRRAKLPKQQYEEAASLGLFA